MGEVVGYITPSLRTISIKFGSPLSYESARDLSHYALTDMKENSVVIEHVRYIDGSDEVTLILDAPRPTYDLLKLKLSNLTLVSGEKVSQLTINPIEMIDIV